LSAVIESGRSIFHWLPPAADAPPEEVRPLLPLMLRPPEALPEVLERSALDEVPLDVLLPAPDVLERSADVLPAPEVLERSADVPPAPEVLERSADVLLPAPDVLDRSVDELPMPEVLLPAPEVLERSVDELLEPIPLLEPLPVLLPDAPAPLEPDSRISETVTSGAPCEAGNVTMATPYPFSILLEDELLRPPEVDDEPLRPLPELLERSVLDEDEELRSVPLEDEDEFRSAPEVDDEEPVPLVLLRSVFVDEDDDPIPLLLLRSVDEDDDDPIPPLLDEEPESPPLELPELLSERRLPLPEPPLVLLE